MVSILKSIEKVKKFQEARQQYQTPAKEQNTIPNNNDGSIGDTVIVNQSGDKLLYIKAQSGWFKTGLVQNVGTLNSVNTSSTEVTGEVPVGNPSGTLQAQRTGNQYIKLTWVYGSNTVSHELYRSSSSSSSFIEPGTKINEGTSSGNYTDNLTSLAVGTWYYKIVFHNQQSVNDFIIKDVFETTINPYQSRELGYLTEQTGPSTSMDLPYDNTELLECAEFGDTNAATAGLTTGYYTDDINFTVNSSKVYSSAQGNTVNFYGTNGDYNADGALADSYTDGWFSQDHPTDSTLDVILNIDDDGDVIGKYSCVPVAPSFSLSQTSTSITVSLSGQAYVTRYWKVEIDTVDTFNSANLQSAYVTPSTKGTTSSGSATGSTTFTSLNSSTLYFSRVRAQNGTTQGSPLHSSAWSSTLSRTTDSPSTSWSNVPSDFTLETIGNNGVAYSSGETITLNNGSGNTVISCSQTGLTGTLSVAVSTSSTPSTSDSYSSVKTIANAGTYYLRFKYQALKLNTNNTYQKVTFTNNNISNDALDIQCIAYGGSTPP